MNKKQAIVLEHYLSEGVVSDSFELRGAVMSLQKEVKHLRKFTLMYQLKKCILWIRWVVASILFPNSSFTIEEGNKLKLLYKE